MKGVGCFLLGSGLVLLAGCGGSGAANRGAPQYQVTALERELYDLTSDARTQDNAAPFSLDLALCKIARAHAEDLAKGGRMMTPHKQKLEEDLRAARYDFEIWGATVTKFEDGKLNFAFAGLLSKPETKNEILNQQYQDAGVGVAVNEAKTEYFLTQVFAKRSK